MTWRLQVVRGLFKRWHLHGPGGGVCKEELGTKRCDPVTWLGWQERYWVCLWLVISSLNITFLNCKWNSQCLIRGKKPTLGILNRMDLIQGIVCGSVGQANWITILNTWNLFNCITEYFRKIELFALIVSFLVSVVY